MRVAFELFGGKNWTGGINYLVTLFSALGDIPGRPIRPVLFVGKDADEEALRRLVPLLPEPPVVDPAFAKGGGRLMRTLLTQRDTRAEAVFRSRRIDLVFQHASFYGARFGLPTLAWLADFQHRAMPQMFPRAAYWKRELGFQLLTRFATGVVVSSNVGREECVGYYPQSRGKVEALPFVVRIPSAIYAMDLAEVRAKYGLPERFFFMPNQFWRHKNHLGVTQALTILARRGERPVLAMSGNLADQRDPEYPRRVLAEIERNGLADTMRMLGMIPFADMLALMRASSVVINPSFYEGWSTTVEEAKAMDVPLLLSDIPVHREQAPHRGVYFNPADPEDMARVLAGAWRGNPFSEPAWDEAEIRARAEQRWLDFGRRFQGIVEATVGRFGQKGVHRSVEP